MIQSIAFTEWNVNIPDKTLMKGKDEAIMKPGGKREKPQFALQPQREKKKTFIQNFKVMSLVEAVRNPSCLALYFHQLHLFDTISIKDKCV